MKKFIICIILLSLLFGAVSYSYIYNLNLDLEKERQQSLVYQEEISNLKDIKFQNEQIIQEYAHFLKVAETEKFEYLTRLRAYEDSEAYGLPTITNEEINFIAKTVYGEARGLDKYQQSMVVWCILNRLDSGRWGNRIAQVVTSPFQFIGYNINHPVTPEIKALVEDVVARWMLEKTYGWDVGRTLPADIMYFHSSNNSNAFYKYTDSSYTKKEYYDWANHFNPYNPTRK